MPRKSASAAELLAELDSSAVVQAVTERERAPYPAPRPRVAPQNQVRGLKMAQACGLTMLRETWKAHDNKEAPAFSATMTCTWDATKIESEIRALEWIGIGDACLVTCAHLGAFLKTAIGPVLLEQARRTTLLLPPRNHVAPPSASAVKAEGFEARLAADGERLIVASIGLKSNSAASYRRCNLGERRAYPCDLPTA